MRYATYSPDDNKLRLYSTSRLDAATYDRVKTHGFKWAPRQEVFVAPAWTPGREDLLIELCGEIGDEDTSLVERQEQRAERFEEYADNRQADAHSAKAAVDAIADGIPFGQPILVGHHSERHARRDAEKIENGMRRAVKMWETARYWEQRAAGALRHAKYKELPAVRARRIKTLEADKRKQEREKDKAAACLKLWESCRDLAQARLVAGRTEAGWLSTCKHPTLDQYLCPSDVLPFEDRDDYKRENYPTWTLEHVQERARECYPAVMAHCDRWIAHLDNRLTYEQALLADAGGLVTDRHDLKPGGQVLSGGEWLTIVRVNKKDGTAVSVTTNARYCRVKGVETIKDYRPPTEEAAAKVAAATKLPPLCNYPGDGFLSITQEDWDRKHADYKGTRVVEATAAHGRHRVRSGMFQSGYGSCLVYITDAKRKDPPASTQAPPRAELPPVEPDLPTLEREAARREAFRAEVAAEEASPFAALKESLKEGVKIVSVPQLFPTPPDLARRVVELADLRTGQRILEPSAGTGNLVSAILKRDNCATVTAVEISPGLAEQLRGRFGRGNYNFSLTCADFLSCNGDLGTFDRVVMNPPFRNAEDVRHVLHALTFLKPGGRLVAIVAAGPRQREQLMPESWEEATPRSWEWIDLPAGAFAESGTNVNAAVVVIDF